MFIGLLKRYSLMLVFAGSLLIGLQLPSFLQQYENRLDARYLESSEQLFKYQTLADLFFEGSLNELLKKHQNSHVAVFKAEADILEQLIERVDFLKGQKTSLNGNIFKRIAFLSGEINQPLFLETQSHYEANIILNKGAMMAGLSFALFSTLLLELFFVLVALFSKRFFVVKIKN